MKAWMFILGAFVALAVTIAVQRNRITALNEECRQRAQNQAVLLGRMEEYQDENGNQAVTIQSLTLKLEDFQKYRQADARVIAGLRGELKRAETIITLQSETITEFAGTVRDTVVLWKDRDAPEQARYFKDSDGWVSVWCEIVGDRYKMGYTSTDSLYAYRHVVPRKFLWFRYGKKSEAWEFQTANPNNTIKGVEVIDIRK